MRYIHYLSQERRRNISNIVIFELMLSSKKSTQNYLFS